jgi:hypothetical protein
MNEINNYNSPITLKIKNMFTKSSDKSMPEYRIAIKICKELK